MVSNLAAVGAVASQREDIPNGCQAIAVLLVLLPMMGGWVCCGDAGDEDCYLANALDRR